MTPRSNCSIGISTSADWMRFLKDAQDLLSWERQSDTINGGDDCVRLAICVGGNGAGLIQEYRGRGIGTRLLERCIEHLECWRVSVYKLDATPAGKTGFTSKLGKKILRQITNWSGGTAETHGLRFERGVNEGRRLGSDAGPLL